MDIALLCLAKTGVSNNDLKEWNQKPLLSRDWITFRVHFSKAHREWKANLRLTVGQHFPRANSVDTSTAMTNHQADTVDALVFAKQRRAMSTICYDVKGASPNSA